jgi:hypothetical protein
MRLTKAVLTIALVSLSIPAFGRPPSDYLLELGDVRGESISITSDVDCASGRLQFQVKGKPSAALTRMCQTRQTIPNLVVVKLGADGKPTGQRQTLQNVVFTGCPTADSAIPLDPFSLNFASCAPATAAIKREIRSSGVIQVGSQSMPVEVESLVINGKRATLSMTKAGAGVLALTAAKKTIPVLTLKMASGQEWSFYQVELEDLIVSGATGDRPTEAMTLNFTKISGPATGIQPKR